MRYAADKERLLSFAAEFLIWRKIAKDVKYNKFSNTKYPSAHFEIKWSRKSLESLQKHHQIRKHVFL